VRVVPATLADKLGTAIASFAELGFDQTRIEDLTVATGVPSSTLYYYFSGKEDVLAFLLRQWLGEVTAAVADAISTDQPAPARDRLVSVVQAQLRLIRDNPDTCRVLLAELGRIARLQDVAEQVHAAFHRPVEELLRAGAADKSIRRVDVEPVTAAIYGSVMITGLHYIIAGRTSEIDRIADELLGFILDGVS
jgi:AcrR family transcriptional regulator